MLPDSFNKIGNMPDKYSITHDLHIAPVQHGRHRVPIEAKVEIDAQLKEMTMQDIITPQVEPTPWVSSLTYLCSANRTLRVFQEPKHFNKAIICEQHKALHITR